jgi:hypothetical protein
MGAKSRLNRLQYRLEYAMDVKSTAFPERLVVETLYCE